MKKGNKFQIAKAQPQDFANFSLALLIKVLLIKKACNLFIRKNSVSLVPGIVKRK